MKITLLNQFFWPDTVATSLILTEVARSLGRLNDVTVVCGSLGAAIADPDTTQGPLVTIVRTRNAGFGHGTAVRIASYISYLAGAVWHCKRLRSTECFVTLTTPPLLPVIASIFAKLHSASHVIWEMDVYPDIATDVGYFKRGGIAWRLSGAVLDWSRRRADVIIALGEEMRDRLVARGVPAHKIQVAENWANGEEIAPRGFPGGPLTILYSGNLGLAHEVETISTVIERLANDKDFHFIFAGGGPRRAELETFCNARSIKNVEFRPYCENAQLSESLGTGHVGLVTQIPATLGSIVPSKIYGIMAAGRPLLYIGPDGSTPARHIQEFKCGWRIEPGDVDGTVQLLCRLQEDRRMVVEAGARARVAFEQHFDRSIGVARILKILTQPTRTNQTS